MKAFRNVGLALVFLLVITAMPVAAEVTTNEMNPTTWVTWVSCANNGLGEWIVLDGYMHVLAHWTDDGNGGYHYKSHVQPQNLSGVGQTTGDKYHATGVTQDQGNGKVGDEHTYVNRYRMIGQGRGNNYLVHETWHTTFNANGEMTADVHNVSSECK